MKFRKVRSKLEATVTLIDWDESKDHILLIFKGMPKLSKSAQLRAKVKPKAVKGFYVVELPRAFGKDPLASVEKFFPGTNVKDGL